MTIIPIYLRASCNMSYIFWPVSKREGHYPQPCYLLGTSSFCIVFNTCAHQVIDSDASKLERRGTEPTALWHDPHRTLSRWEHRDNIPFTIVSERRQQASSVSQAYGMLCGHMNFMYCIGSSGKAREVLGRSHTRD